MAIKQWNGMTILVEDGYFPDDVVKAMHKRLAEEEKAKKGKAEASAKKSAKKPTKKDK